ncbi:MAG: NAD(P)/FAD-dependent oxidoreductase [Gemmatimonadaceae bacterium]
MTREPPAEHFDVLVIGAGLSGIGAGYHLQTQCPGKRYAILEARSASGGTWDLFRYPGVRSDSDMFTLGYRFRPWLDQKAIADGPDILRYIRDTASEYGIDKRIRYGHKLTRASWSSNDAQWTVEVEVSEPANNTSAGRFSTEVSINGSATKGATVGNVVMTCNVLYSCMGYYDYRGGYTPEFPNAGAFKGPIIHPQQWPEHLDYHGKRVVVIGSGATAITIVPAMAETAAHVTMLQRSPTYVMARSSTDDVAQKLRAALPPRAAYAAVRWKNVTLSIASFWVARKYPAFMKRFILKHAKRSLNGREFKITGIDQFDAETHFSPQYNPWDQRMCLAPDADFFKAVRNGKASVVTDSIQSFTANGIQLESGRHLDADIIVTATGLKLQLLSGVQLVVDGVAVQPSQTMVYKGMMFSDVPNFVSAFGYTNASWTLKVDLTADYVCRLLHYMDARGFRQYTPRQHDPSITPEPILDFTSGYVQRALTGLPSQGSKKPWRVHQNYARDLLTIRFGKIDDGVMEFR